jgi:hypothetical protein
VHISSRLAAAKAAGRTPKGEPPAPDVGAPEPIPG